MHQWYICYSLIKLTFTEPDRIYMYLPSLLTYLGAKDEMNSLPYKLIDLSYVKRLLYVNQCAPSYLIKHWLLVTKHQLSDNS